MKKPRPPIDKLFGRRKGRPLHKNKTALVETLLPTLQLTLSADQAPNVATLFPFPVSGLQIEIGFGSGDHLAAQALTNPTVGFIGCEPFLNGIANLLEIIDREKIQNIRVYPDDARHVLDALPPACLDKAFVLYPDPWPKARHERRRFINPENLARFARVLKTGGTLQMATDVAALAVWMDEQTAASPAFSRAYKDHIAPQGWVPTRYEQKGLAAGRTPTYLIFKKQ